jgi:drug/metabolite transporter (DMT)-like permease
LTERKGFSSTDFYLFLATVLWGSDYLFAKIALREVSALSFAAIRTLISTAVLVPIFLRQENEWRVKTRQLLSLGGLALLGAFLNRIFWSTGVDLTTASNASLLATTSPIFVLMISFFLFRITVSWRAALGILVSFIGISLVIQGDWKEWVKGGGHVWGDLLMLLASVTWAFFTVLAKFLMKDHSSLKVMAYIMLIGSILFLPFLPNEKPGGWGGVSLLGWVSVFYVAITGNFLAYLFWMRGIQNIGPMRTILYSYLTPITAILFAIPFLGETLTAGQVWGALIVFAGIFLARSG